MKNIMPIILIALAAGCIGQADYQLIGSYDVGRLIENSTPLEISFQLEDPDSISSIRIELFGDVLTSGKTPRKELDARLNGNTGFSFNERVLDQEKVSFTFDPPFQKNNSIVITPIWFGTAFYFNKLERVEISGASKK